MCYFQKLEKFLFLQKIICLKYFCKNKKIKIYNLDDFSNLLLNLKNKKFLIDPNFLPLKIYHILKENYLPYQFINCPVDKFKAIKNPLELSGFKNAHLKDGLAILKFLFWFEKMLIQTNLLRSACLRNFLIFVL